MNKVQLTPIKLINYKKMNLLMPCCSCRRVQESCRHANVSCGCCRGRCTLQPLDISDVWAGVSSGETCSPDSGWLVAGVTIFSSLVLLSNIWSICLKVLRLVPNPSSEVCLYSGLPWDFNQSLKQPVRKQETQIIPSPAGTIQLYHISISHKHLNVYSSTSTPLFFQLNSHQTTL